MSSNFRYEEPPDNVSANEHVSNQHLPRHQRHVPRAFKDKVQRSLSCERSKHARQMVKTFKISSDRFQENLTKLSSNINNKLDTRLSTLNCMNSENADQQFNDWYKPSTNSDDMQNDDDDGDDDKSAGFVTPSCNAAYHRSQLTTPTTSLETHQVNVAHNFNDIKSPSLSVFSCTEPQVDIQKLKSNNFDFLLQHRR